MTIGVDSHASVRNCFVDMIHVEIGSQASTDGGDGEHCECREGKSELRVRVSVAMQTR